MHVTHTYVLDILDVLSLTDLHQRPHPQILCHSVRLCVC